MQKKILKFNILFIPFLLLAYCSPLCAQSDSTAEKCYSDPRNGIFPTPPVAYFDSSVVSKTECIVVELSGEMPDTTMDDTSKCNFQASNYYDYAYAARINRFHRGMGFNYFDDYYTNLYWYTGNPYYWGYNIYYSWDPWYSPWWNSWYYPGWGGSHWMVTYGWGWSPYWSFGLGWWYGAPFNGNNLYGHGYSGSNNGNRINPSYPTNRNTSGAKNSKKTRN